MQEMKCLIYCAPAAAKGTFKEICQRQLTQTTLIHCPKEEKFEVSLKDLARWVYSWKWAPKNKFEEDYFSNLYFEWLKNTKQLKMKYEIILFMKKTVVNRRVGISANLIKLLYCDNVLMITSFITQKCTFDLKIWGTIIYVFWNCNKWNNNKYFQIICALQSKATCLLDLSLNTLFQKQLSCVTRRCF